jgi:hypothetical protein
VFLTARELTSRFVGAIRSGEPHAVRAFEVGVEARRFVLLDALEGLEGRPGTQRGSTGCSTARAPVEPVRPHLAQHPRDLRRSPSARVASAQQGRRRLDAPDSAGSSTSSRPCGGVRRRAARDVRTASSSAERSPLGGQWLDPGPPSQRARTGPLGPSGSARSRRRPTTALGDRHPREGPRRRCGTVGPRPRRHPGAVPPRRVAIPRLPRRIAPSEGARETFACQPQRRLRAIQTPRAARGARPSSRRRRPPAGCSERGGPAPGREDRAR